MDNISETIERSLFVSILLIYVEQIMGTSGHNLNTFENNIHNLVEHMNTSCDMSKQFENAGQLSETFLGNIRNILLIIVHHEFIFIDPLRGSPTHSHDQA